MSTLAILHQGEWKAARIVGYGMGGSLMGARLNLAYVTITISGASFSPKVELASGSQATVRWVDLSNGQELAIGVNPTIQWQSAVERQIGLRVETGATATFADVLTLNFGFNHNDDAGVYDIGASYDYVSQSVTSVTGLQLLTGLRRFLAAGTPLTGVLDVSNLSNLEYIECFGARVESVDLTGCTNLIRLCMESNRLTTLDLNPVRHNLYDLRAAVQYEGVSGGPYSLTFATLDGPMDRLYHYCIRDQRVNNIIPHAQLPVIQQCWTWNTGQTTIDSPTSSALNSYLSYNNNYDQASVDRILTAIDALIPSGSGIVDISGGASAAPSPAGTAAASNLQAHGWTVNTN